LVQGRVFDNVSITSQLANDAAVVLVDENDLAVCRALDIVIFTTGSIVSWVVLFQRARGLWWGSTLKEGGALCQDGLESIVVLGRDVLVKGDASEDAAVSTQVPARDQVRVGRLVVDLGGSWHGQIQLRGQV
jgi:hypothetical protein